MLVPYLQQLTLVRIMGVGAQNDLGGHQSFARTKLPDKSIVFSVQIEVTSKKKVFTHIETVFLSSAWNILLGKLVQTT